MLLLPRRVVAPVFSALALLVALLLPAALVAEEPFAVVSLSPSAPTKPDKLQSRLDIRASSKPQSVYVYVHNPNPDDPKDVEVQLRAGPNDTEPLKAKVTVKPTETAKVDFLPVKDKKPIVLGAAGLEINVGAGGWKPAAKFQVRDVEEFLVVQDVSLDGKTNELKATLQALEDLDPPCPVALEILPERMTGLKTAPNDPSMKSELSKKGEKVVLSAKGLEFEGTGKGLVYITVDGTRRAFIYEVPYGARIDSQRGIRLPDTEFPLAIAVRPYAKQGDKLDITIEINGKGFGPTAKLEAALGHLNKAGKFETELKNKGGPIRGMRKQTVTFLSPTVPGAQPALAVATDDWTWTLQAAETKTLVGEKRIEVTVDGKPTDPPATATVTFISSAPTGVRIASKADSAAGKLKLIATSDNPELIDTVEFFEGKSQSGQVPKGVEVVKASKSPEKPEWTAMIGLPTEKTTYSVHFVNKVGLDVFKETSWDPATVTQGSGSAGATAIIKGVVKVGDQIQPGVPVKLAPAKAGEEGQEATTDDDGHYIFKDVKPGTYTVSAEKKAANFVRRDSKPVTVKAGDKKPVDLSLLQPPVK